MGREVLSGTVLLSHSSTQRHRKNSGVELPMKFVR